MEFRRELIREARDDILQICEDHYKEVSSFQDYKISPNLELFETFETLNKFFIFTAREGNVFCGYASFCVSPHCHYANLIQATQTLLYLRPEFRGNGMNFISYCDKQLKEMGVNVIFHSVTEKKDFSSVLLRLGYSKFETTYMRKL